MVTLRRILFVEHLVFLLLAAILIGASFGGFLGGGCMIASAISVIVLWGVFAGLTINAVRLANGLGNETGYLQQALTWVMSLFGLADEPDLTPAVTWAKWLFLAVACLSAFTGLGLAFLALVGCGPLWLPDLYHWGGMAGTILGFVAFLSLPAVVRACLDGYTIGNTRWWWFVVASFLALVWGLVWIIVYFGYVKDNVNLSDYKAKDHVYQLPFAGGESSWVIQGNNTSLDHNDNNPAILQKFSWDFRRECGTPVLAARKGTIKTPPIDTNDGFSSNDPNNQIMVDHGDGTVAYYLHIQKGSVPARLRTIGANVNQGDQIAEAGCVGISLTGHIHFMVKDQTTATSQDPRGHSIGVSFTDVSGDNGIPRTFGSYTSGNRRVP